MISMSTEVTNVVNEFRTNRKLFTAYDVTQILRHRLDGEKISHNDVKNEVHSIFDADLMGIYERTQINVGTKISPFVYHLNHQDPNSDYDKDWVNDYLKNKTVTPNHVVVSPSVVSKTVVGNTVQIPIVNSQNIVVNRIKNLQDGFKTITVTSEGRLNIPVNMLNGIGRIAYVSISKARKDGSNVDALSITSDKVGSIKNYKINSDGRLRISNKFLKVIGESSKYAIKDCTTLLGRPVILVIAD